MKVLVFAAHPDDPEFAMGGTLLHLAKKCFVTICVLTDGGAGTYGTPGVRKQEQQAAADFVGAKLRWLGKPDCSVENTRALAVELAQIIRDEEPTIVLTPHWDQRGSIHDGKAHPDHRELGFAVRDAARLARFRIAALTGKTHCTQEVWYYMATDRSSGVALSIPVDAVVAQLQELWACHTSQLSLRDGTVADHLLSMRANAAAQLRGVKYAEHLASDAPVNADLVAKLFYSENPS
jgi:LmbE family N-acetylglucosaminyl deacetylase